MNFDEVIQLQALKLKAMNSGLGLGRIIDQAVEGDQIPDLRQMCAKVSRELYQELEDTCQMLDMSKRQFIEGAVSDALKRAQEIVSRVSPHDQGVL